MIRWQCSPPKAWTALIYWCIACNPTLVEGGRAPVLPAQRRSVLGPIVEILSGALPTERQRETNLKSAYEWDDGIVQFGTNRPYWCPERCQSLADGCILTGIGCHIVEDCQGVTILGMEACIFVIAEHGGRGVPKYFVEGGLY